MNPEKFYYDGSFDADSILEFISQVRNNKILPNLASLSIPNLKGDELIIPVVTDNIK